VVPCSPLKDSGPFTQIKSIEAHQLAPSRDEILRELLLRIGGGVDLSDGAQLRMRAEDEVDARASPSQFFALAVTTRIHTPRIRQAEINRWSIALPTHLGTGAAPVIPLPTQAVNIRHRPVAKRRLQIY